MCYYFASYLLDRVVVSLKILPVATDDLHIRDILSFFSIFFLSSSFIIFFLSSFTLIHNSLYFLVVSA